MASSRPKPDEKILLIDSDAFILLGGAGLVQAAGEVFGLGLVGLRRLFPLPLMLEKGRLARKYPAVVREKVVAWCSEVEPVREAPSEATRQRLLGKKGIDDGEEILLGLVFENPGHLLLTNDKTALRALRNDPDLAEVYRSLCGRIACVESVLRALSSTLGATSLAESVAPMRPYNGMLNAVFSRGTDTALEDCRAGLTSYIEHLESEVGPDLLIDL